MSQDYPTDIVEQALDELSDIPYPSNVNISLARQAFLTEGRRLQQGRPNTKSNSWLPLFTFLRLGFQTSAASAAMMILLVVGVGVIANAAAPGDALYGLDRRLEQIRLNLTMNSETADNLHLRFANERLTEARRKFGRGENADGIKALEEYETNLAILFDRLNEEDRAEQEAQLTQLLESDDLPDTATAILLETLENVQDENDSEQTEEPIQEDQEEPLPSDSESPDDEDQPEDEESETSDEEDNSSDDEEDDEGLPADGDDDDPSEEGGDEGDSGEDDGDNEEDNSSDEEDNSSDDEEDSTDDEDNGGDDCEDNSDCADEEPSGDDESNDESNDESDDEPDDGGDDDEEEDD